MEKVQKLKPIRHDDLLKIADKIKKDDKFAKRLLEDFEGTMKKEGYEVTEKFKKFVASVPKDERKKIAKACKERRRRRYVIHQPKRPAKPKERR